MRFAATWRAILTGISLWVAACFSEKDLRDAECSVGCKTSGYSGGELRGKDCVCFKPIPYERATGKRLVLTPAAGDKSSDPQNSSEW